MQQQLEKFWAGGFLYNPETNEVFLHHRDKKTRYNPDMWAFFGGLNEGDETPVQCFVRELDEEIGLKVPEGEVIHLDNYMNVEFDTYRYVFYVESNVDVSELRLGEGAGFEWVSLVNMKEEKYTEKTLRDLNTFKQKLGLS